VKFSRGAKVIIYLGCRQLHTVYRGVDTVITIYVYAGWYSDHYVCIYLGFDTMITMFLGFLPVLLINLEVRAVDFDQY
jgi:hypothetical protein